MSITCAPFIVDLFLFPYKKDKYKKPLLLKTSITNLAGSDGLHLPLEAVKSWQLTTA